MSLSSSSKRLHGGRRCIQLHLSREQLLQQIGWVQHKFMVTIYCFIDQLIKTCVWFIIVINSCSVWVDDADRWTSDLRAVFDFRWVAVNQCSLCNATLCGGHRRGQIAPLPPPTAIRDLSGAHSASIGVKGPRRHNICIFIKPSSRRFRQIDQKPNRNKCCMLLRILCLGYALTA